MRNLFGVIAMGITIGTLAIGADQGRRLKECPIALPDTGVMVTDTSDGIMVSFMTSPVYVMELQRRVERWSNLKNLTADAAKFQDHMIAGNVRYRPTFSGARLTFVPSNPARLTEFRMLVRMHVEEMEKGYCSPMENMMQSMNKLPPET
jgi:hypothetical protein